MKFPELTHPVPTDRAAGAGMPRNGGVGKNR